MSRLAPRLVFLALLGGGLLFWSQLRKPRELVLEIDLTQAMPGEITEVDVVVRRDGHALARHDVRYGAAGAPGLLQLPLRASPGDAEVETTLVYAGKPARKSVSQATLAESPSARVRAP
jgi:hypothetical protein